jgi:patatin-like phospholipase/acyl hydrolase
VRVLSIDGGGIRGLIPALVLAEVEARCGRPVATLFDAIAGTSTGGILACALSLPDPLSARELVGLYEEEGPRIFSRSAVKRVTSADGWLDERYDDAGLNAALTRYLGDARLSEATCDVFVTAYDIRDRFAFFFRSARARADETYDFRMWEVARATSAAPTYFEPVEVSDIAGSRSYPLVDGGVFATNPAACVHAEYPDPELLLSLGTGAHTRRYAIEDARGWGQLGWARPVLDMVFDGMSETTDFILGTQLGERYVRLQCELDEASDDLDDASEENLARLRAAAEALVRDRSADIDRVCDALTRSTL